MAIGGELNLERAIKWRGRGLVVKLECKSGGSRALQKSFPGYLFGPTAGRHLPEAALSLSLVRARFLHSVRTAARTLLLAAADQSRILSLSPARARASGT